MKDIDLWKLFSNNFIENGMLKNIPEKILKLINFMKKIALLLLFILFTSSCQNILKAPEFKGIQNISFKQNETGQPLIVAHAAFRNPNLVGGKFQIDSIKVFVDGKFMGNLNSEVYKVPAKKSFNLPLEIDFNESFLKKNNNSLSDMLDILTKLVKDSIQVKYQGKILYVSHGLKIPYKIDYQENIKIFKK